MATGSYGSGQRPMWDDPVSDVVCHLCHELKEKLLKEDPMKGVWSIPSTPEWKV